MVVESENTVNGGGTGETKSRRAVRPVLGETSTRSQARGRVRAAGSRFAAVIITSRRDRLPPSAANDGREEAGFAHAGLREGLACGRYRCERERERG